MNLIILFVFGQHFEDFGGYSMQWPWAVAHGVSPAFDPRRSLLDLFDSRIQGKDRCRFEVVDTAEKVTEFG